MDAIKNTLLVSSTGRTGTLGSLATVEEIPGQTEVRRENLQRNVTVTARLEGVDLGAGIAAVQQAVADLHLPPAIRVEYGGAYDEQQQSFHDLLIVLVLAVVLVFTVLLFEFGGFAAPIAVIASALLSTVGVFLALLVTRHDVQPVVVHGPDHGDRHRREERHPAARRGSAVPGGRAVARGEHDSGGRTAAAADHDDGAGDGGGMIPLALGWGAGSQMLQPLAIAVIGGILGVDGAVAGHHAAVHYYLAGDEIAKLKVKS